MFIEPIFLKRTFRSRSWYPTSTPGNKLRRAACSINIALLQSARNVGYGRSSVRVRIKHPGEILNARRHATLRQALQKQFAIALGLQARVENGQHAAIGRAAYQPS